MTRPSHDYATDTRCLSCGHDMHVTYDRDPDTDVLYGCTECGDEASATYLQDVARCTECHREDECAGLCSVCEADDLRPMLIASIAIERAKRTA